MSIPLIELKGIGKIYVSDNNVSVGIRGVNLSFQKGEFVAITGKSGSGKSTLLSVISGMDSYEEGEMLVEGEPTSHYMQKDWEEYRKKYISFIFQEYNIIESFTVLQNVELALMHIDNFKERREKAIELIQKVGLEKFMHHKGSKLSGGQKQRTVIARALAKDSPVILADEPTGNLDSQTSEEIINLLREVSKDKLLIIVTHNFEQVEHCATRHIRVFDGAVEADTILIPTVSKEDSVINTSIENSKPVSPRSRQMIRNGCTLGWVRFKATPKLTVFLCLLMTISSIILTGITSLSSDAKQLYEPNYMFEHINGRCVVTKSNGTVMTEEELKSIAEKTNAENYLRYDYLLDRTTSLSINLSEGSFQVDNIDFLMESYPHNLKLDGGRLPQKDGEVVLYLPICYRQRFGKGETFQEYMITNIYGDYANESFITVTGVAYYYDNTKTAKLLFTESGLRTASALQYFYNNNNTDFSWNATLPQSSTVGGKDIYMTGVSVFVDYEMPEGQYGLYHIDEFLKQNVSDVTVTLTGKFKNNIRENINYSNYYWDEQTTEVSGDLQNKTFIRTLPNDALTEYLRYNVTDTVLVISPDILADFMTDSYFSKSYSQASLFYGSDDEAHRKVKELRDSGFIGVPSDETVEENELDRLLSVVAFGGMVIAWVLGIIFIMLFIILCTSRTMNANKGDIAIMRSMGIPTKVVKISLYVQTSLSLIPAFALTGVVFTVLYMLPTTNSLFSFLHIEDYAFIALLMVSLTALLSHQYCKKMFKDSVKKTLKGGNKQ